MPVANPSLGADRRLRSSGDERRVVIPRPDFAGEAPIGAVEVGGTCVADAIEASVDTEYVDGRRTGTLCAGGPQMIGLRLSGRRPRTADSLTREAAGTVDHCM